MSTLIEDILGSADVGGVEPAARPAKAVSWCRVSTNAQEERGLSLPEQRRQVREYAEANGIEIVDEFSEAVSAFKQDKKRVEFHRMLDRAKSDREISAILVHDYSRFSRDSLQARTLIRDLKQSGVKVISLNDLEADPETVAGVYLEAITFAKNEAYSREVAFHTRKGCRANVQTRDSETGWCYKNGGQPLWGYRAERLTRGEEKRGRPIIKCIWVPDDRVVAGKPVHEWAKHCLVELAAKGATLHQLRDFCNDHGIPAPRQRYWGHTTWNSLLHPSCLLQYAGYGVWNVRGKKQRRNPASEWVIVENAHEALIGEDDAKNIIEARRGRSCARFKGRTSNRARSSRYLLSGGLFKCTRCDSNMIGFKKANKDTYYLCGSQPNRRGLGCGPGVYVPQGDLESEVIAGLRGLLDVVVDPEGFTRQVNAELRRIWEESSGYDPDAKRRLAETERKIENIRQSIEDGMPDTEWGYTRMQELMEEKRTLEEATVVRSQPPQIDVETALSYRKQIERLLAKSDPSEARQVLKTGGEGIELFRDTLEVEITYRIPEPVVNSSKTGPRSHCMHQWLRVPCIGFPHPRYPALLLFLLHTT